MQQYIEIIGKEELKEILERCGGKAQLPVFTEERRKEVLESRNLAGYVKSVSERDRKWFAGKEIRTIPFTKFELYEENGNRTEFENCYFERRRRLVIKTILVLLYGRKEDVSELENIIWAICDEYMWALAAHLDGTGLTTLQYEENFKNDLFACETACALAEAIHFCGEMMHRIVVKRAMRLVTDRVLRNFIANPCFWEKNRTNWAAVCGGNMGTAAIYAEKAGYITSDELAEILYRTEGTMQYFLEGFPGDGTCGEGLTYWTYGFGYFTVFADMMRRRTCGEIDWFKLPHVQKIAEFHQKCFFSSGRIVTFSDAAPSEPYSYPILSYLADEYDTVSMPDVRYSAKCCDDSCARFAREIRTLLWGRTETKKKAKEEKIYVLKDPSWYVATSGDNKINFAAKAGRNDEAHNHNDVGSFFIFKNGKAIFADLGAGEYTREYFSSNRYNVFCCCSRGHSVPVIGEKYQCPGGRYRASDVLLDKTGITMDMAGAYGNANLKHLTREVRFEPEKGAVTLADGFEFDEKPETVCERFITYGKPEIKEGTVVVTSADGKESLELVYDPELFTAEVLPVLHTLHEGEGITVYCTDLTYKDKTALKGNYTFWIK